MIVPSPTVGGEFLTGADGPLAIVVWDPPQSVERRFSVLHVPAFGDEMNKSRRMVAVQARALAAIGGTVALLDPRGTGDSAGDHGTATWDGWQADVLRAWAWLVKRTGVPCVLWGVRLGALLAADIVARSTVAPAALLLWQPVASGRSFFTQFLRLATIQQRIGDGVRFGDAKSLRVTLAAGDPIEVGGYELSPSLVAGAEAVDLAALALPGCAVIWGEISSDATPAISPAMARIVSRWREAGTKVDVAAVNGPAFWTTQEIAEASDLIAATTTALADHFTTSARMGQ